MIVTIDQLRALGLRSDWEAKFMDKYGGQVEVTRERLLSEPLCRFPGFIACLCDAPTRASFDAALGPIIKASKLQGSEFTHACAECLADAMGLPGTKGRVVTAWPTPPCRHEYVNVGFSSVTMACKHCGADAWDTRVGGGR